MKKHNFYRDIVWISLFCVVAALAAGWGRAYKKEQKSYGFRIWSGGELTADMTEEFKKLAGICRFEPMDTMTAELRLSNYTLETEVVGVDLLEYPLKWNDVMSEIPMGGTPAFFFGTETFASFTDGNGVGPGKSQIEKWMKQYQTLELTVKDENGRERKARICGILSDPGDRVCMDKVQMKEAFFGLFHTAGGFMEIYGQKNMKKARSILEAAGFVTE